MLLLLAALTNQNIIAKYSTFDGNSADDMSAILTFFLTVVRHGETDYNVQKISQGQMDVPLNENGKYQATLAGKALKDTHFDIIYSSDLSRAFETATEIVDHNTLLKQPFPITSDILLREMSNGIFENKPSQVHDVAAMEAGFEKPYLRKFRPEGGENEEDVSLRAQRFLAEMYRQECVQQNKTCHILVVSHGLLLRELIRILLEKENSDNELKQKWKNILIAGTGPNTGISKFQLDINSNGYLVSAKCLSFLSDDHLKNCSYQNSDIIS